MNTGNPAVYVCCDVPQIGKPFFEFAVALGTEVIYSPCLKGVELFRSMLSSYAFCFFLSVNDYESIADILASYLDDTGDPRPVYIYTDDNEWQPATGHETVFNFSVCSDGQLRLATESFRRILEQQRRCRKLSCIFKNLTVFVSVGNANLRHTYLRLVKKYGMRCYDLHNRFFDPETGGMIEAPIVFILDRWTYLVLKEKIDRYLKEQAVNPDVSTIFFIAGNDEGVALQHGKIVNRRIFPLSRMIRLFREQRRNDRFADRCLKRYGP